MGGMIPEGPKDVRITVLRTLFYIVYMCDDNDKLLYILFHPESLLFL